MCNIFYINIFGNILELYMGKVMKQGCQKQPMALGHSIKD